MNKGFSLGLPSIKLLQKPNIDLKLAVQLANNTKQGLQVLKTNTEEVFKRIFEEVKTLPDNFDIEIKIPRISKRQIHRSNRPTSSPE